MSELKENLNDTKYLLEDSEIKSINIEDNSILKNNYMNNTQLLLEDKTSILYEIPQENNINNDINNDIANDININNNNEDKMPNNNNSIHSFHDIDNNKDIGQNGDISIKEIMDSNNTNREEREKEKDEQEIIKQQNILLNNQSSHLEELFSLSYTELSHHNPVSKFPNVNNKAINNNTNTKNYLNQKMNKDKNIDKEDKDNIKKIYFGVLFPTEHIIKNIFYQNNDQKKIVCFQISKNQNNIYSEYFKILIDKNKNYFNLKSNEEINIKILLEIPFLKNKKQIQCELNIIDINNNIIDSFILYANVEIPKLCCLRYSNLLKECKIPLIQIKTHFDKTQQFRIPFKNLSIKDLKINFFLLSSPNKEDIINKYIDYEISFKNEKNVNFPSLEVNYLELILNIKKKKELNENENNWIKIKKIIQANIVDTKINYYFCFELILINENMNYNDKNGNAIIN